METATKRLAAAAAIGMFLVLLMGAAVTNTGSGEGCGRSWPLCHGEFIPSYAFTTMVEYSHRLVTGIEGFLIVGVALAAMRMRRRLPVLRVLVPLMVVTLLLQAGMGAWAVHSPQAPLILALHFGISLVCFASVFLIWRVVAEGMDAHTRATSVVPAGDRWLAWGALLAVTLVAYLGAYVRHSGANLACHTWPLCNGDVFPGFDGPVGVAFAHRLAASAAIGLIVALAVRAGQSRLARPQLAFDAFIALGLILLQALAGAAVVLSRLSLASTLAHAALMALLFVSLADACRLCSVRRYPSPATSVAPASTLTSPLSASR